MLMLSGSTPCSLLARTTLLNNLSLIFESYTQLYGTKNCHLSSLNVNVFSFISMGILFNPLQRYIQINGWQARRNHSIRLWKSEHMHTSCVMHTSF